LDFKRSHPNLIVYHSHHMIKKLAVPLINEKILMQAEHCYIATAAISEGGFELVRSRLPTKCKIEIVTGLDELCSPEVLRKIFRHYQDRISFRIYTRNFFHANVYIFDLPYRKTVAFTGSGPLTLGGLKDDEEFFYRTTDPKEIEAIKSWFTGYFEFAEPLTEALIDEYEIIYPEMRQRQIASREEKRAVIDLTSRGFSWESIKFKNQFFKREDYQACSGSKAALINPAVKAERESAIHKLNDLHETIRPHLLKLRLIHDPLSSMSNTDPTSRPDHKIRELGMAFGLVRDLKRFPPGTTTRDFITVHFLIRQKSVDIGIWVDAKDGRIDRSFVAEKIKEPDYVTSLHKILSVLGKDWLLEIAGEIRSADSFTNEESVVAFFRKDDWRYYKLKILKNFSPGSTDLTTENIGATMMNVAEQLIGLYHHLRVPS
jgi:hypothetical protein